MDYSENYTCSEYEKVQSAYINKSSVTRCPTVVDFKNGEDVLVQKSFIVVVDENYMAHYLNGSPTSQYRNSHRMIMIVTHDAIFHVRCYWLYFQAGHGKGPCDGVGVRPKGSK